ncbi:MAG: hypothetical protein A2Y61_06635 [Chloroflexi bacterium RBG_13_60_13]|nr:MAG: hypothetical protein A2Y61_06635 [Chloroflexi bacterium RBG_13_60_13]
MALAVLTAFLVVSKAPRAVPSTGTSPRADFTVPAASFTTRDRLLPRLLFLFRLATDLPVRVPRSTLADGPVNMIAHDAAAANGSGRGGCGVRNRDVTGVADPWSIGN